MSSQQQKTDRALYETKGNTGAFAFRGTGRWIAALKSQCWDTLHCPPLSIWPCSLPLWGTGGKEGIKVLVSGYRYVNIVYNILCEWKQASEWRTVSDGKSSIMTEYLMKRQQRTWCDWSEGLSSRCPITPIITQRQLCWTSSKLTSKLRHRPGVRRMPLQSCISSPSLLVINEGFWQLLDELLQSPASQVHTFAPAWAGVLTRWQGPIMERLPRAKCKTCWLAA